MNQFNIPDLTNQKFGRLLVIKQKGYFKDPKTGKNRRKKWLCKCDCGKETLVATSKLRNGHTKSCGCIRLEKITIPFGKAGRNAKYASYRNNALKKQLNFDLTIEQFENLTQNNCYYCNSKPSCIKQNKYSNGPFIYNGIDRVDNKKGYTVDNCVTCCKFCNKSKSDLTQEEFLNKITSIYNYFIKI